MFSLLIFSLGLHFLRRPLLPASRNYGMPGDNNDGDEEKHKCWSQATDMMDNSPTVPGGAAILKWDSIFFLGDNFYSSLIKKDYHWWIAPWRWSHMKLTEHPFQDLMMLVSGCGGGFWTTMEPNSHRLPVWPPWMPFCRCWCFLPWCTLYVMTSMVMLIIVKLN